jgi:hypothetical protein
VKLLLVQELLWGYCQLVEVQTQFTCDERCFRGLGRFLDTRHLLPGIEGLSADHPCVGGGQKVPTKAKPMVDGSVGRQESLGLPGGFKSPPLPFLLLGRLMRDLGPVI